MTTTQSPNNISEYNNAESKYWIHKYESYGLTTLSGGERLNYDYWCAIRDGVYQ